MHKIIKYRAELMGIATLVILIHHYYTTTGFFLVPVIPPLAYFGVEMFLFLSGFGLCLGYGKYRSVSAFYKKRFTRIYPTYLTILIIDAVAVTSLPFIDILIQSTTLPAYLDIHGIIAFDWYVPAIVLLYLLFPLFYYLISKGPAWSIATLICSFIPIGLSMAGCLPIFNPTMIGRIPVFVSGILAGALYLKKTAVSSRIIIALEIIAVIGILAMFVTINRTGGEFYRYFIAYIPFVILTPGICFLSCRILGHLPESVSKALGFIGAISLEVFLIHSIYLKRYANYLKASDWWQTSGELQWLGGLGLIVSAILLGYLVSVFVKYVTRGYDLLKSRMAHG